MLPSSSLSPYTQHTHKRTGEELQEAESTGVTAPYKAHLGDAQGPHVLAVGRGAVPRSPGPSQEAADALHPDPAVDGVLRRRRGAGQAGAGVVIPHGLQHGGDHPRKDAEYPSQADGWHSPLACKYRARFRLSLL